MKKNIYYEIEKTSSGYTYKEVLLNYIQYKSRKVYSGKNISASEKVIKKRVKFLNNQK